MTSSTLSSQEAEEAARQKRVREYFQERRERAQAATKYLKVKRQELQVWDMPHRRTCGGLPLACSAVPRGRIIKPVSQLPGLRVFMCPHLQETMNAKLEALRLAQSQVKDPLAIKARRTPPGLLCYVCLISIYLYVSTYRVQT